MTSCWSQVILPLLLVLFLLHAYLPPIDFAKTFAALMPRGLMKRYLRHARGPLVAIDLRDEELSLRTPQQQCQTPSNAPTSSIDTVGLGSERHPLEA